MNGAPYLVGDVRRAYDWFAHSRHGVTEVSILHPDYQRGDHVWNRAKQAWPMTRYVHAEFELLSLVRQYAGQRLLCYGINPREQAFYDQQHRPVSAKEGDIAVSQSLVLDVDLQGTVSSSRLATLTRFLSTADEYFRGLGLQRPVRASSGNRGSHLLFAYPPVLVAAVPDFRDRLRIFRARFARAVKQDLDRLEAKVDTGTLNLRAAVKVYGTGKVGGAISRFYGKDRIEDRALRDHLLSLYVPDRTNLSSGTVVRHLGSTFPSWFLDRLSKDRILQGLWDGTGKCGGDRSNSGYDFSVLCRLAALGYREPDDLGTIINLRPVGQAERLRKGKGYIERTVRQALATARA